MKWEELRGGMGEWEVEERRYCLVVYIICVWGVLEGWYFVLGGLGDFVFFIVCMVVVMGLGLGGDVVDDFFWRGWLILGLVLYSIWLCVGLLSFEYFWVKGCEGIIIIVISVLWLYNGGGKFIYFSLCLLFFFRFFFLFCWVIYFFFVLLCCFLIG